jgi:hypothetical protein
VSQLTPTPSKRPGDQTLPARPLNDEMPDPDNLRIDRTDLITLPMQLPPAPSIGERLAPARHRAEYTRSA